MKLWQNYWLTSSLCLSTVMTPYLSAESIKSAQADKIKFVMSGGYDGEVYCAFNSITDLATCGNAKHSMVCGSRGCDLYTKAHQRSGAIKKVVEDTTIEFSNGGQCHMNYEGVACYDVVGGVGFAFGKEVFYRDKHGQRHVP